DLDRSIFDLLGCQSPTLSAIRSGRGGDIVAIAPAFFEGVRCGEPLAPSIDQHTRQQDALQIRQLDNRDRAAPLLAKLADVELGEAGKHMTSHGSWAASDPPPRGRCRLSASKAGSISRARP